MCVVSFVKWGLHKSCRVVTVYCLVSDSASALKTPKPKSFLVLLRAGKLHNERLISLRPPHRFFLALSRRSRRQEPEGLPPKITIPSFWPGFFRIVHDVTKELRPKWMWPCSRTWRLVFGITAAQGNTLQVANRHKYLHQAGGKRTTSAKRLPLGRLAVCFSRTLAPAQLRHNCRIQALA